MNTAEGTTRKLSKDEIIAAIQACAAKIGRAPSLPELQQEIAIHPKAFKPLFGSYTQAVLASGLERHGSGHQVSMDKLFEEWAGMVREIGKAPSLTEYGRRSKFSVRPLRQRFGLWHFVPAGMLQFAQENRLEDTWADVVEIARKHCYGTPTPARTSRSVIPGTSWPTVLKDRPLYGSPMAGPGMSFTPVNEMGVVFLFGAMAAKLGYTVSWVGTHFPDCEAFREVEPGRWQRVRIEFEFLSRNFMQHFHDPEECDLIVCWEHNWAESPLEVVELKRAISMQ